MTGNGGSPADGSYGDIRTKNYGFQPGRGGCNLGPCNGGWMAGGDAIKVNMMTFHGTVNWSCPNCFSMGMGAKNTDGHDEEGGGCIGTQAHWINGFFKPRTKLFSQHNKATYQDLMENAWRTKCRSVYGGNAY